MLVDGCPFCMIIRGTIPAHKVYEDDDTLAFLDIRPMTPGHTLVIPKDHVPDVQALDEPFYTHVLLTARRVALALDVVTQPKKVGFMVVGFDVPHAHVHVLPLHDPQAIMGQAILPQGRPPAPTSDELAAMAGKLRSSIASQ